MRIDVFVPSLPFSREAERTRVLILAFDNETNCLLSSSPNAAERAEAARYFDGSPR